MSNGGGFAIAAVIFGILALAGNSQRDNPTDTTGVSIIGVVLGCFALLVIASAAT